jgi:hypothetical protein
MTGVQILDGYFYSGGAKTDMGLMRGDVDGRIGPDPSVMKNIREGLFQPI